MKRRAQARLSIKNLRRIFNVAALVIVSVFLGSTFYLYGRFANTLSPDPEVDETRSLLTNFRSEDFEDALERLQKRRDLPDPDPDLRNPFGQLPR